MHNVTNVMPRAVYPQASKIRNLGNIWANFPKLSNLDRTNLDESNVKMLKEFVLEAIASCFKSPFLEQNFGQNWSKLLKTFRQIFDRNINSGNFAAVKFSS